MATTSIPVSSCVDSAPGEERREAAPVDLGPGPRPFDRNWLALSLAGALIIAAVDTAFGEELVITDVLVVPPLVAAMRLGSRSTGAVGLLCIVLSFLLLIPNGGELGTGTPAPLTVAIAAAITVIVAELRDRMERARNWTAFMARVSTELDASMELDRTLESLARLPLPGLADLAFIDAADDDGRLRRAAAIVARPGTEGLAAEIVAHVPRNLDHPTGPPRVIRTGELQLVQPIGEEELGRLARGEAHLDLLRRTGVRAMLSVPLRAGGRIVGAVTFGLTGARRFGSAEVVQAQAYAGRAALAVDNARLFGDLRTARDEVEAILAGVADGVTAMDTSGRLVYANETAVRAMGLGSVEEALSAAPGEIVARFEMLTEEGEPFPPERLPGRRALAGETPEPVVVRFRPRDGGEERSSVVKARAVHRSTGPPLVISVMEDVTESKREERRQRFLARAGELLGASLDVEQTMQAVADLAVPEFADWCAVEVVDRSVHPTLLALAHTDPEKVELAYRLRREYPTDPESERGTPQVLRTGEAEHYREIPDAMLVEAAQDDTHLELMRSIGLTSGMVVPMRARGRPFGVITFALSTPGRSFDETDLELGNEIARRAALAIDNARLYRDRAYIAHRLQESLLPPTLPEIPGFDVAARFRAAGEGNEVGGDFYDAFPIAPDRWMVVMGDVCGKGADAAAITAQARHTLRAAAMHQSVPSLLLHELNEALLRHHAGDEFCTVVAVRLDLDRDGLSMVCCAAGHPLPILRRADGRTHGVGEPGTLLGVVPDPDLFDVTVPLQPGDAVLLYTDGVTEAGAPHRLLDADDLAGILAGSTASHAAGLAEAVEAAADTGGGQPRDDIAILVMRVPEAATDAARSAATQAEPQPSA